MTGLVRHRPTPTRTSSTLAADLSANHFHLGTSTTALEAYPLTCFTEITCSLSCVKGRLGTAAPPPQKSNSVKSADQGMASAAVNSDVCFCRCTAISTNHPLVVGRDVMGV